MPHQQISKGAVIKTALSLFLFVIYGGNLMDLIKKGDLLNTLQIEERIGAGINKLRIVPFNDKGLFVFDLKRNKLYIMDYTEEEHNHRRLYRCTASCNLMNIFDLLSKEALEKY